MTADIASWRDGSRGFFKFLDDVQPRILDERGRWVPYRIPSDEIRDEIARALDSGRGTIVLCWPRRHGKTLVSALIVLWRFLSRTNESIALVANSEKQVVDTAFRLVRAALERTPYCRAMLDSGAVKITESTIRYEAVNNSITGYPSAVASLYGLKLSIAQVSELHAARTLDLYNALTGSTLDRTDGLVLVDSTAGTRVGALGHSGRHGSRATQAFTSHT